MRGSFRSFKSWNSPALLVCGALMVGFVNSDERVVAAEKSERRPVLVELFTSEGCSSCPPADALLARLDEKQIVPGARVIVLSEHVTYWDRLGWRDPFSQEAMTRRQQEYGHRFGLDDVYTPQAVVDGAAQLVGSDERGLRRDISEAAQGDKIELQIQEVQTSRERVQFKLHIVASGREPAARLIAAIAEDAIESSVTRGENAGRTLRHVAVVRSFQDLGSNLQDGHSLAIKLPDAIVNRDSGSRSNMRLVVFLTDAKNGHVLGVDEQTFRLE
jgi:hypothetical protein